MKDADCTMLLVVTPKGGMCMNLSTRELLYLEDLAKLFESINKNCSRGLQSTADPQVKTLLTGLTQSHQQWIQTTAGLVNSNGQTLQ
jgi:hypothetical protein